MQELKSNNFTSVLYYLVLDFIKLKDQVIIRCILPIGRRWCGTVSLYTPALDLTSRGPRNPSVLSVPTKVPCGGGSLQLFV